MSFPHSFMHKCIVLCLQINKDYFLNYLFADYVDLHFHFFSCQRFLVVFLYLKYLTLTSLACKLPRTKGTYIYVGRTPESHSFSLDDTTIHEEIIIFLAFIIY